MVEELERCCRGLGVREGEPHGADRTQAITPPAEGPAMTILGGY